MSQQKPGQAADSKIFNSTYSSLYKVGGAAPLIALTFYLIQILAMISGGPFPATTEDWVSLFQRNKILGLLYLNALDIFSIALLGTMFLALYIALKRYNQASMLIATYFATLGVGVFIVPRVAMLSIVTLSDQYTAAATEAQRATYLTAIETLGSLGTATNQTVGFLFIAIASLIISVVILRSETFTKTTGYVGILASIFTFANDICLVVAPSFAVMLMPISGLLWLIWWIMVARRLLQLGRSESKGTALRADTKQEPY